ncbi:hypothetical protein CFC21_086849 [Triticum aestivum]|uniref:Uncharacterized protein n=2 Tax=Triticum aestivum TaxID=4565 RepID=A0A3B6PIY6_WHEAT|nr:hypothetical protein CFC21_086849 [Triticum aestivum]
MTEVQVELDCQCLVNALQGSDADLVAEGILFREIRHFARLNFNHVSFLFAPRACHNLARLIAAFGARRLVSRELWPESLPDDVLVRKASGMAGPV